jgi:hypothetical protein
MELIEMIVWIGLGFVPTLTFGNYLWSKFEKDKLKTKENIPWSI